MKKSQAYEKYEQSRFFGYFKELCEQVNKFRESDISFYFFQTPVADRIQGLSEFERERLEQWTFDFNHITEKDIEKIKLIYGDEITNEYLMSVYDGAKVVELDGVKCLTDFESPYVNIIAGKRMTTDVPKEFYNSIHIFGQCTARGTGVEDKDTIASILQRLVNVKWKDSYAVINHAVGCGSDLFDDLAHMKECAYTSGDIVVLCSNLEIIPKEEFIQNSITYHDCSHLFQRPHCYGEWFTDMTCHTNRIGNEVIANYIWRILNEDGCLKTESSIKREVFFGKRLEGKAEYHSDELTRYIEDIKKYVRNKTGRNGAIVMNCNPFTKGHQYLIEEAAKQVDHLYIFVVEEDKSFFPFVDRLRLVQEGIKHIQNVTVLPSGKFIISAVTFPGYFYKEMNNSAVVDTSKDVSIFGGYIAPALGITVRFAGEEPLDYVTRQYNQSMKEILPKYGIEFCVIKRKEAMEGVISASRVRHLLKAGRWQEIEQLVPESTYAYLKERFQDIEVSG